jgi:plastocyanin
MRTALAVASAAALLSVASGATALAGTREAATPARPAGTPATPRIVIHDFGYSGNLLVRPGVRVKVVDKDAVQHTLTHKAKGHFDTGAIPANGGVRFFTAPKRVGRYPFGCLFHPDMTGTLVVRRATT